MNTIPSLAYSPSAQPLKAEWFKHNVFQLNSEGKKHPYYKIIGTSLVWNEREGEDFQLGITNRDGQKFSESEKNRSINKTNKHAFFKHYYYKYCLVFISNLLLIYDLHFYKTSEWAVCKESTVQHRTQSMWEYRSSMQVHTEEYTCEWQISVTHQAATSSDHNFIVKKSKTTQNQDVHSFCL